MLSRPEAPPPLFTVPPEPRARTSDVILALAERAKLPDVTIRTLSERLGDRTFGMLLVLVAIFNVVPFVSALAGLLVVSLGLQMSFGMRRAWLPRWVLDHQLPAEKVRAALLVFEPKVRAIERYVRPRWQFTEAPIVDRMNGLVIALLGVIIALPVPFANMVPAIVVIVMGLGLMERDGVVQVFAACAGLLAVTGLISLLVS